MLSLRKKVDPQLSRLLEWTRKKGGQNWISMVVSQHSRMILSFGKPEERSLYIMMTLRYLKCRLMDMFLGLLLMWLFSLQRTVSELPENTKES